MLSVSLVDIIFLGTFLLESHFSNSQNQKYELINKIITIFNSNGYNADF